MEGKKLKLLSTGRKGILLPQYPKDINDLYQLISLYMNDEADHYTILFKDEDGDECEIINQDTYEAALLEFSSKFVLKLLKKDEKILNNLVESKGEGKKSLIFFKKKTRDMAIFNIETELLEWHKLPKGIALKEYAAWVELPSGEVFYCGGGHPVSSDEVYLINPISRSFKKLPSMLNPRHSHAILYINGYVYIFGGIENTLFYGALTNKSERFCLRDSYWEEIENIESPRGDAGAAVSNDSIYILGKGSNYVMNYNTKQIAINLE